MTERVTLGRLQVAANLQRFIEDEVLPGTGIEAAAFWQGLDALVHDLAPKNRELLAERDRMQVELDSWHKANPGPIKDMAAYRAFLESTLAGARCMTRSTAPTPSPKRAVRRRGRATTKSVAPRSLPTRAISSIRPRRWRRAAMPTPPPTACRTVS